MSLIEPVTRRVLITSTLIPVLFQKTLTRDKALGDLKDSKLRCIMRKDMGNAHGASQNGSFPFVS